MLRYWPVRSGQLLCCLLISILLILCAVACGGGKKALLEPAAPEGELLSSKSASVRILPETYLAGGSARKLTLTEREEGGDVLLELRAQDAEQLKALYVSLEYDPGQLSPAGVESAWAFAAEQDSLQLLLAGQPGVLEYGEQCLRPQEPADGAARKGIDGDGLLATIRLAKRPFSPLQREAMAPTVAARSQSFLSLNVDSFELSWGYASNGDYNQNGTVAVTDLTPIGAHFLEEVPSGDQNSIQAVIDGNGNGEIGVSDLTAIGLNFGITVNSYNVYASTNIADIPTENDGPNGPGAELKGTVPFRAVQGDQFSARRSFSFTLPQSQIGWFYWVRPNDTEDGAGADGTPSSVASFGGVPANLDPVAAVTADPLSGGKPLEVNFDASGSSDPDGLSGTISDIVQFQWDFDGNGLIDDVTTEPTVSHTYRFAGLITARLTIFDAGAASSSANIGIGVGVLGNNTPVASLTANVTSGQAPIFVKLNANESENGEGQSNGIRFEWDFEGDGIFDQKAGSSVDRIYSESGTFNPTVRVTDDIGQQATTSIQIEVLENTGNQPPLAVLLPDPIDGDVGDSNVLRVELDISQCADPDGSVTRVAFDQNSDGAFERTQNFSPGQDLSFARFFVQLRPGISTATLLVQDNLGTFTTTTAEVRITKNGSFPPVAVLEADVLAGDKPLLVNLDATASSDPDGSIVEFAFDLDGDSDGDFQLELDDIDADGLISHVLENGGRSSLTVRVTDDAGLTDRASIDIEVNAPGNQPPQAAFSVSASSGDAPFTVTLDASASADPDGSIVDFAWGLLGNGELDFNDRRASAEPYEHTFMRPGETVITLQVTDNDGATDFSSQTINVNSGWEFATIAGDFQGSFGGENFFEGPALASLPGSPGGPLKAGLAYSNGFSSDFDFGSRPVILYVECEPGDPLNWSAPVGVFNQQDPPGSDIGQGLAGLSLTNPGALALQAVDGRPAICFGGRETVDSNNVAEGLYYVRAEDELGASWPEPFEVTDIADFGSVEHVSMGLVGGRPAISFDQTNLSNRDLMFMRALDVTGSQWPAAALVQQFDSRQALGQFELLVVDGIPAISYGMTQFDQGFRVESSKLFHVRAQETEGLSWGAAEEIADEVVISPARIDHALVAGNPASTYLRQEENFQRETNYVRASSPLGGFPADPVEVQPALEFDLFNAVSLAVAANLPCVAHTGVLITEGPQKQALFLSVAKDPSGSSWHDRTLVIAEPEAKVGMCRLLRLNADLLIVFDDSDDKLLKAAVFRNFQGF